MSAKTEKLSRRDFLRRASVVGAGLAAVLVGCQPKIIEVEKLVTKEVEKVVKETVIVAGTPKVVEKTVKETVIVEKVVEKPVEKVVTATPEPITIEISAWGSGQPAVYEKFMEEHPDIKVVERLMEVPALWAYQKTRILAGEPPDIIQIQPGAMVREFYESLMPLDDWIAADPEIELGKFVQPVLATVYVEGKMYAIPQHPMVVGMIWYEKSIFEELGAEVPTNYGELLSVCKAAREAGYLPLAFNGMDAWNRAVYTEQVLEYAAPGKFMAALEGQVRWTDPDLVEGMDYWRKLTDDGILQDGVWGAAYGDVADPFFNVQAAMITFGSWAKGGMVLRGIRSEDIVCDALPMAFPDITSSDRAWKPGIACGHVFAIPKEAPHPFEAWDVMRTITLYGDPLANYPVLVPAYESDIVSPVLEMATDMEQLDAVKEFELGAWKLDTILDEWWYPEVRDAACEVAAGVGTGAITADQAMQEVQAVFTRVVGK